MNNRLMLATLGALLSHSPEQGKHRGGRASTQTPKERQYRRMRRRLAKQGRRAARRHK